MSFDADAFAGLQASANERGVALSRASGLITISSQVSTLEEVQAVRDVCNLVAGFLIPRRPVAEASG